MAITYRTDGDWGTGKGANLTAAEVDENFYDLDSRVDTLETSPPEAISIQSIDVAGNQLTITLTDASVQGPFTLPVAQWAYKGPWQPNTVYVVNDLIDESGSIYLVLTNHTSAETFDPEAEDENGFYYSRLLSPPRQPYDIGMYYNDAITSGTEVIMAHVAARRATIPLNFADAKAFLLVATSTSPLTFPIYLNEAPIGLILFSPGELTNGAGQYGTFEALDSADILIQPGDILTIALPYEEDETARGLVVTIPCFVDALLG